jgi:glycosyltransferase involved in cell wall biosynthesis
MFSVVIPLFNKAHTIQRTLSTVLSQEFADYEVIIVNDGSTDNGVNIIKAFTNDPRVIIVNQTNEGVSSARNKGVLKSRYDYIAFLDGDDEWLPNYLLEMKNVIDLYPNAGMYCCAGVIKDKDGTHLRLADKYKDQILPINYFENPYVFSHTSATIVSKVEFFKTQGFPIGMKCNQDFALFFSLAFIAPVIYCGKMLSIYVGGIEGQTTSVSDASRFKLLPHIVNRINLCYKNWATSSPKNMLYLVYDKYETRGRFLRYLKNKNYASIDYFINSLDSNSKKHYSSFELWIYKTRQLRMVGICFIYFTKLIWRSHGFPIVGHNK